MLKRSWRDVAAPVLSVVLLFSGVFKISPLFSWLPVDLTVIVCAFIGIALFGVLVRERGSLYVDWRALLLFGSFIPAWFWSDNAAYGEVKAPGMLITALAVLASFYLLDNDAKQRNWVRAILIGGVAVLASQLVTSGAGMGQRFAFEGSNTIATARITGAALVAAFILALSRRAVSVTVLLLGITAWLAVQMIATGSRGPVVAAALAVVVVVASTRMRGKFWSTVIIVACSVAAWVYIRDAESVGATRIEAVLTGEATGTESRDAIWAASFRIFEDPLATMVGLGWADYGSLLSQGEQATSGLRQYPHNVLLEILTEAGIVVAALAVAFIVFSLLRLRDNAEHPYGAVLFGVAVFSVANAMVSGDLNDNRLMWASLALAWVVSPVGGSAEDPPEDGSSKYGSPPPASRTYPTRVR